LDAKTSHYLQHVLRLSIGAPLQVFDGKGNEYQGQLIKIHKSAVEVAIGEELVKQVESPITIHLAQAFAKGEKMDLIVQKAVELGVSSITPLITERSEVKLSAERLLKRIQHLQAVAISACEQCGRNQIPSINSPQKLTQWLSQAIKTQCFVLHPKAAMQFSKSEQIQDISLIIGPEGGWEASELELFTTQHIPMVSLGPRVLRTETAAIAAMTIVQYQYGDLGGS
jgi:16S rRNA (uracil1498-N3)-methyltransferase